MSDSASKSRLNRDTVGDNETIFDFLKRKKQFNLQNTVNKSLHHHSYTKRKMDLDLEDQFPQGRDISKYQTNDNTSRYTITNQKTITPKKIQFEEKRDNKISQQKARVEQKNYQPQHPRQAKSFLAMISPIKNRASSALQERKEEKENQFTNNNNRSGTKGKSDNFSRKNVTKCINSIKDSINYLSQNIKNIKQKSHGLVVLFNPIFNYLSQGSHPATRQVGDLRNKLRSFEAMVDDVNTDNCDEAVENFHRNLEEHLQSEEGFIKRQGQRAKNEEVSSIKNQKQVIIQRLQLQLKKANKEIELLNRRLQKVQNNKGDFEEAVTEREINYVEQMDRMKSSFEEALEQLKNRNDDLQSKYEVSQQKIRQLQKDYKNERMVKDSQQGKFREEIQQITEAKDAYLLNEIMVLKAEFNADMARMNELHKIKEAELLARIDKKEEQIKKKSFERGCDKQIEFKIVEEASQMKQQNMQLKTRTECLVTDMYRMNEQLYQHWMALKDIKQLSTRLGSFVQFRKIYDDLIFNDHLFS